MLHEAVQGGHARNGEKCGLVAVNAADVHRLSFIRTVLPEASRRGVGVIAMKVCSQGQLLKLMRMDEALAYVWSLPGVCHAIVGCRTPAEVDANAESASRFRMLEEAAMRQLEERTRSQAAALTYYKAATTP